MIESQWLSANTRPLTMLAHIDRTAGTRKKLLIAVAGLRLVEELLPVEIRTAIDDIERSDESDDPPGVLYKSLVQVRNYRRAHLVRGETWETWQTAAQYALIAALDPTVQPGNRRCFEWVIMARTHEAARGAKQTILGEIRSQLCNLIREIVGNPFQPWQVVPDFLGGGRVQPDGRTIQLSDSARSLAEQIHIDQAYDRLPILADALEESSVTDAAMLAHCRSDAHHLRGCWALEVVCGR